MIEGDHRFPYDLVKEIYSHSAKDFADEDIAKECFKDEEVPADQKAAEKPKPNNPPAHPSDNARSESNSSCSVS